MTPTPERTVLPSGLRRRRFTAPHRRRSLLLRLARPFLVALAVVAAPVGVAAWVLTAPQFRLRTLEPGTVLLDEQTEPNPALQWERRRLTIIFVRQVIPRYDDAFDLRKGDEREHRCHKRQS